MRCSRRRTAAFTLIELLLVISIMVVLAGLVLPSANPAVHDQLLSASRILAGDLAYARSLAVSHCSTYRVTFSVAENRYTLEHDNPDKSYLNMLPAALFESSHDAPDRHVVALGELVGVSAGLRLEAVGALADYDEPLEDHLDDLAAFLQASAMRLKKVDHLRFHELGNADQDDGNGQTIASGYTLIWLGAGSGDAKRYIVLYVNPVTGLTTIGDFSTTGPPSALVARTSR